MNYTTRVEPVNALAENGQPTRQTLQLLDPVGRVLAEHDVDRAPDGYDTQGIDPCRVWIQLEKWQARGLRITGIGLCLYSFTLSNDKE